MLCYTQCVIVHIVCCFTYNAYVDTQSVFFCVKLSGVWCKKFLWKSFTVYQRWQKLAYRLPSSPPASPPAVHKEGLLPVFSFNNFDIKWKIMNCNVQTKVTIFSLVVWKKAEFAMEWVSGQRADRDNGQPPLHPRYPFCGPPSILFPGSQMLFPQKSYHSKNILRVEFWMNYPLSKSWFIDVNKVVFIGGISSVSLCMLAVKQ